MDFVGLPNKVLQLLPAHHSASWPKACQRHTRSPRLSGGNEGDGGDNRHKATHAQVDPPPTAGAASAACVAVQWKSNRNLVEVGERSSRSIRENRSKTERYEGRCTFEETALDTFSCWRLPVISRPRCIETKGRDSFIVVSRDLKPTTNRTTSRKSFVGRTIFII
eukprot:GHVT01031098.1.p1 GENE.GHVT01031098.1~~GHVT01031098.1.p1  ORF type:complete len:165 (-),score=13.53 GHVT01031098.1:719-1213(-)